jgi:hypothetical protein
MKRPTLKPSDLRAEAQRLIKAGRMPTLDQLLEAIFEVQETLTPCRLPTSMRTQTRCSSAIAGKGRNERR